MIDGVAIGQVEGSCDLMVPAIELPDIREQFFSLQYVESAQRVAGIATHPFAGSIDALDAIPFSRRELKDGLTPTIPKAVTVSTIFSMQTLPLILLSRHLHVAVLRTDHVEEEEEVLTADLDEQR
jgi:hypothetical protein